MNVKGVLFFASPVILALAQCAEVGTTAGSTAHTPAAFDYTALTLKKEPQSVVIENKGKLQATCRTELPHVEQFRFVKNKSQVVIKSRADHGPAMVELFDSRTGARRARVMAYEISNGQPDWAIGMKD